MSNLVVLSSPPAGSVPVPSNQWRGLVLLWEGPDGSVWDLTDYTGGVILTREGLEGLHFPRITKYSSASRAVPGKRLRGWRAEGRDVFWPLYVWADGTDAWLERAAAFFSTIHPENAGTWRVRAGSEERTLQLTGVFDETHLYTQDPSYVGWSLYGVALEAAQPYWQGQRIRRGPWSSPDTQSFFGDGAPPFTISSSGTFASATIPNPGDVEAYGIWSAVGPLTGIVLGVGDTLIRVPFDLGIGDVLTIDTDPRNPTATLNGVNATRELGMQEYAAVPPGASVPLHVEAAGTGQIIFDLVPLYFRAF